MVLPNTWCVMFLMCLVVLVGNCEPYLCTHEPVVMLVVTIDVLIGAPFSGGTIIPSILSIFPFVSCLTLLRHKPLSTLGFVITRARIAATSGFINGTSHMSRTRLNNRAQLIHSSAFRYADPHPVKRASNGREVIVFNGSLLSIS